MTVEDRRIFFDNFEVYSSLCAMCANKHMKKPPPGVIKNVYADKKDSQIIHIVLDSTEEHMEKEIEHTRDFLAAALILFCHKSKIPLPKNSKKSVIIDNAQVILRITQGSNSKKSP